MHRERQGAEIQIASERGVTEMTWDREGGRHPAAPRRRLKWVWSWTPACFSAFALPHRLRQPRLRVSRRVLRATPGAVEALLHTKASAEDPYLKDDSASAPCAAALLLRI